MPDVGQHNIGMRRKAILADRPVRTATVCIPAPRPASRSCSLSPTITIRAGAMPVATEKASKGAGSGLAPWPLSKPAMKANCCSTPALRRWIRAAASASVGHDAQRQTKRTQIRQQGQKRHRLHQWRVVGSAQKMRFDLVDAAAGQGRGKAFGGLPIGAGDHRAVGR